MIIIFQIVQNFVKVASWFPVFFPEDDGDGFAKVVEVEAGAGDGVHDGGVVDDSEGDVLFFAS